MMAPDPNVMTEAELRALQDVARGGFGYVLFVACLIVFVGVVVRLHLSHEKSWRSLASARQSTDQKMIAVLTRAEIALSRTEARDRLCTDIIAEVEHLRAARVKPRRKVDRAVLEILQRHDRLTPAPAAEADDHSEAPRAPEVTHGDAG